MNRMVIDQQFCIYLNPEKWFVIELGFLITWQSKVVGITLFKKQ